MTDYSGFLMAQFDGYARNEYVCVDLNAQMIGSSGNENGALLYPVEFPYGTASLDGLKQYFELTCTVCSSGSAARHFLFLLLFCSNFIVVSCLICSMRRESVHCKWN